MMGACQRRVKRGLDIAVSCVVLALAAPVMAVAAIAVRRDMGSPVLFRQLRPGLGGEVFELVKLRTMLTEQQAGAGGDADRLTPLGKWLRETSIDELPTLWNVLKGDMSLVGPRPLLVEYLPLYSAEQARRHDVRPGMTGLAQARGRNALTWHDKFTADVEYVDHQSLALDANILWRTALLVLRRDGVNHQDSATMPVFTGFGCSA